MPGSAVTDLAGRVLAGRYRLQSPIGTGASGRVYVAEDVQLRRRVAVKVLHEGLADDAAFLRRFRAEAQVAAGLHHPHIVTVHDWGDDDQPFLVLELLSGGSLRTMLDRTLLLTPAQAARIGRDVASALEYAHARGIVHRDIKPANLLFDEHGNVRVADFGLARALAEASWTEPAGAVVGTVRYASPEQAMGVQLDPRSDLYSLALVLVEAVTGRLPFASDTTLGMLTARTQRPLVAPEELGPLAAVVERAGRIDRAERYPDAATMRAALTDVADTLPKPTPLPLPGVVDAPDPHPTRVQPARDAVLLFDQDAIEISPVPPKVSRSVPARRWIPAVVVTVVALTVGFALAGLSRIGGPAREVPGVVGRAESAAVADVRDAGFDAEVVERRESDDPAGVVLEQHPAAGAWRHDDGTVELVVSKGPKPVEVPDLGLQPVADALKAVQARGLVAVPSEEYSATVPAGAVVRVEPAPGSEVAPDSTVTVVVSKGHEPVPVPDVANLPFEEAQAAFTAANLKVKRVDDFHDEIAAGRVISTEPPIGEKAPYDSEVVVHVSKGPDLVTVPKVTGLSIDAASERLAAAGLEASVKGSYKPGSKVKKQDPAPGDRIRRGSTVTISF